MTTSGLPWTVDQALSLVDRAREIGEPFALAYALGIASRLLQRVGDPRAFTLLDQARRIYQQQRAPAYFLAITDIDLGVTHHLAGNLLEAKHAYADALLLAKELGLAITIQTASLNLGEVLLDMGDPHAAIKALVDGSNIVNGSRGILTMLSGLLAEALQSIGQQADVASRAVGIETSLEKMAVADPSITYYLNRLRKTVLSPRDEADAPMRKFEQPKGSREDSRNS